jgi:hypothetical protein
MTGASSLDDAALFQNTRIAFWPEIPAEAWLPAKSTPSCQPFAVCKVGGTPSLATKQSIVCPALCEGIAGVRWAFELPTPKAISGAP